MRAAFSSPKQAAAFALLLLAILLSPLLLRMRLLPPRESLYSSVGWEYGAFPYLQEQIYHEKEPIDIALMGTSTMWFALDTPHIEKVLSKKLGRRATVRTLCWDWPGADAFYFIAKELLEHRKVRMIVFCDPMPGAPNTAHKMASHWFRWNENAADLNGVGSKARISFYGAAIQGIPRNLLGLIRSELPAIPTEKINWSAGDRDFPKAENPANHGGALTVRFRMDKPFEGEVPTAPADLRPESALNAANFERSGVWIAPMQTTFLQKIAALAKEHEVKMAYLHVPLSTEMRASQYRETVWWPDFFGKDLPMIGIPPAILFSGLSDEEIHKMYYEYRHLNENGQKYFTPVITPALVQIYEKEIRN
jgi:hypothetical protein